MHFGELSVTGTGGGSTGTTKLNTQSLYAAAIGKVPVSESFSVFGKFGLAVHRTEANSVFTSGGSTQLKSASDNKVNYLLGGGVGYQFTKELTGLVDYTYFDKVTDGDLKLSLLSVGLRYAF